MGPPRQRLTWIAGYWIGGDQSGGTGTILQTGHDLASFQSVELHLIPASQGLLGGMAAWPHAAVRHHRAQSPQYLSKQTSGGTIDEAPACQERKCFVSSGEGVSYPCIFFSRIWLNTRNDTGQTATQIPNRSAWAACKAALKAGSLTLARTGLIISIPGPKYHTIHANGTEMSPNQNRT
jgi:hypothetical protein